MTVWHIIIPIAAILFLVFLIRLLPSKGKVGEKRVARRLDKLPEDEYRVFNDVMIPTPKGTSQIDHVVVSEYGIFVIETKFYQGWIYGGEFSEHWTQNIYGTKHEFYNPVLQNAGHVRVLQHLLKEFGDLFIYPIVTFSAQADLKVNTTSSCVIYWRQIVPTIRRFSKKRLTAEQVRAISRKIEEARLDTKDKEVLRKHNRDIWVSKEMKQQAVENGRCPRCGGKLIERQGKFGRFYGCSNYPKCRYTHEY